MVSEGAVEAHIMAVNRAVLAVNRPVLWQFVIHSGVYDTGRDGGNRQRVAQ